MPIPIVVGMIAASAVSALASYAAQSSANDRAKMIADQNFQQWMQLNIPDPEQQKVILQKFVSAGELDPVLEDAIKQNPTEFSKIVKNPRYEAAQLRALKEFEDMGSNGGLRLSDKEQLQEAMMDSASKERGDREALLSEMARRGTAGSGAELASRLASEQGAADRNAQASLSVAAGAQDRSLQALKEASSLAGSMGQQDYQQQTDRAAAQDAINKFNTANLQDVMNTNVGLQNSAKVSNLANKQDILNKNTTLTNAQETYNKGLQQQNFDNRVTQMKGATGASETQAAGERRGGEVLGNTISNLGGAVVGGLAAKGQQDAQEDFWSKYFKSQKGK